ncbi:MAG: hypothetical protein IPM29_02560 [Planctomycetes bacterium]|nr:hypothetical protein [Planctomycetota bacterium]
MRRPGYRLGVGRSPRWEWDGNDWTQLAATVPSGERTNHGMTYDAVRDRLVVHGGRDTHGFLVDTWEWDGVTWLLRTPAANPGLSAQIAMTFDPASGESLLFGGQPYMTWTYAADAVASTRLFGSGCAGTAGTPTLAAVPGSRPWLGDRYTVEATRLPPSGLAYFEVGFSNQSWFGLPLPFDLTPIGMTGCTVYTSGEVLIGASTGAGTATLALTIPNDAVFAGRSVFMQVFAFDPGANPFGGTTSNALEARLGAR